MTWAIIAGVAAILVFLYGCMAVADADYSEAIAWFLLSAMYVGQSHREFVRASS